MKTKLLLVTGLITLNLQLITLNCIAQDACGGLTTITDTRDGQTYGIVAIGSQCWMKQNLNYAPTSFGNTFCYNDNPDFCNTYGRLYDWPAALQVDTYTPGCNGTGQYYVACATPMQGICPSGWHVPSHYEWNRLERTVSGADSLTFPYDETTTAVWLGTGEGLSLQVGGASGFDALLGGYRVHDAFGGMGANISLWTSTATSTQAWSRGLLPQDGRIGRGYTNPKTNAFALRCIKDNFGTELKENTKEVSIAVLPNPNNGIFTVEIKGNNVEKTTKLEIMNSLGQVVLTETIELTNGEYTKQVDISNFPQGIYLMKIEQNNDTPLIQRIVVQ